MADAPATWREPTSRIPLRWGSYRTRWLAGLALVLSGGIAIAGGSPLVNWLLAGGTIAHLAGWAILPSAGWRRILAMGPSVVAMWALLAGPTWLAVLLIPYLGWLLVRHRPLAAYPTTLFVLAGAVFIARLGLPYSDMPGALGGEVAVLVASAWAARAVHAAQARSRLRRGRKPGIPGVAAP
jgi:hypothetical protein